MGNTPFQSQNGTDDDMLFAGSQKEIDVAISRAIYASGVPLSVLDSKYWQDAFRLMRPDYNIPSRYSISGPNLEAEYSTVKSNVETKLQNAKALGLITDGWTSVTGKTIINFVITTPKPIFYKCVYPETEKETGNFIGEELNKIISEVGSSKFVAVITDNAANMKSAWTYISERHPHISCVGCISHTLNLLNGDIIKLPKIKDTINKVLSVIKFVKRKTTLLAVFEKIQIEKYGKIVCTLKLPSKTRWNGNVIALQSYVLNREALELLAISHNINIEQDVKSIILDESIWILVQEILKILEPISRQLETSESDKCLMSDVPEIFSKLYDTLSQEIESNLAVGSAEREKIVTAVKKRREFCIKPIHLAANILDPRYRGKGLLGSEVPSTMEFIYQAATYMNIPGEAVMANIAQFKSKTGYYGESDSIWTAIKLIEPRIWWQTFAPSQDVAPIAARLLSVPPSSASSERNWSLFSNTHTLRRNRLQKQRIEKLVFIKSNLCLSETQISGYESTSESEPETSNLEVNNSIVLN